MPEMTEAMARASGRFLREAWPVEREVENPGSWTHQFSTSYQIACMALVALGEAEETASGARPLPEPRLPAVLPLWEDVAVAVLKLARQHRLMDYRRADKSLPERRTVTASGVVWKVTQRPQPDPNVAAGRGTGPAWAAKGTLSALEALGLVRDGRWTDAAEPVLWRHEPGVWGLRFEEDARFVVAVEAALADMPDEVRAEIDRLMHISAAEVTEGMARIAGGVEDARLRWGPKARFGPAPTTDHVRASLLLARADRLDWIFFLGWRLDRGWLGGADAARALAIFHDRLAIALRRAVVARLYPGGFVWA